jgi:hypothetical protein
MTIVCNEVFLGDKSCEYEITIRRFRDSGATELNIQDESLGELQRSTISFPKTSSFMLI